MLWCSGVLRALSPECCRLESSSIHSVATLTCCSSIIVYKLLIIIMYQKHCTEAIIMSRILYAAPAWWGLTQASDILKINQLQRKLQRIEYASHDQPIVESKVHKADEKLFKKVIVEED